MKLILYFHQEFKKGIFMKYLIQCLYIYGFHGSESLL